MFKELAPPMRVTKAVKDETRHRILKVSRSLFRSRGFDQTTTTEIANEANIAKGTVFNYFPSKELIAVALIAKSLEVAQKKFEKREQDGDSFEEDLFDYAWSGIRSLRPHKKYVQPVIETCLCPVARAEHEEHANEIKAIHLQTVSQLADRHGFKERPSPVDLQLYWTLYSGIVAFWASDSSPHQEDTLAMLDQSTRMFANWISAIE